jgi:hypothetical protein
MTKELRRQARQVPQHSEFKVMVLQRDNKALKRELVYLSRLSHQVGSRQ